MMRPDSARNWHPVFWFSGIFMVGGMIDWQSEQGVISRNLERVFESIKHAHSVIVFDFVGTDLIERQVVRTYWARFATPSTIDTLFDIAPRP